MDSEQEKPQNDSPLPQEPSDENSEGAAGSEFEIVQVPTSSPNPVIEDEVLIPIFEEPEISPPPAAVIIPKIIDTTHEYPSRVMPVLGLAVRPTPTPSASEIKSRMGGDGAWLIIILALSIFLGRFIVKDAESRGARLQLAAVLACVLGAFVIPAIIIAGAEHTNLWLGCAAVILSAAVVAGGFITAKRRSEPSPSSEEPKP